MTTATSPYRGFRFPAEVIEHAVWLYHCFSLSLRDVELILAARGVIVSDNGTELTLNAVLSWAGEAGIDWHYIAPGKSRPRTAPSKASTVGCGMNS